MKVTTSKSKNSESFYLNQSYIDSNGKSTSRNFKKLGTLEELKKKLNVSTRDEVLDWCKEECKKETLKLKEENEKVMVSLSPNKLIKKDDLRLFNVGYLYLNSLASSLRLDKIFRTIDSRHKYEYDLEAIFKDLIYSRILEPNSKRSSFEFINSFIEKPKYELHDIYRSLSVLAKESDYIQSEVYRNSNFIHKRNKSVLYYDCTNYYFEIENEDDLRKYGKSKEHRPNPIVTMGMFMDSDGIPLSFDIWPGNLKEQKTLKPLEEKIIRDYDIKEFIFCSDAGLGSINNRVFNDIQGRAYIITKSLKKLKENDKALALNPSNFKHIGKDELIDISKLNEEDNYNKIFYKIIPLDDSKLSKQVMIVTYSIKYKNYQKKLREKQIGIALNAIKNKNKLNIKRRNPNDPLRLVDERSLTENGEVAEIKEYFISEEKIAEEAKYDGFYAVVTDLAIEDDKDIEKIININRNRWEIEECFRIMKSEFDSRPVYVRRDDRIKAHFLICYMALLLFRLLEKKLNSSFTAGKIIKKLREMNVVNIDSQGYIPTYTRDEITETIHSIFNFRTDYQIIKKSKMRNIIKLSKEYK